MDARNLADRYQLPEIGWADVETRLGRGFAQAPGHGGPDRHTCWLTTLNDDGSPHVTGIGAVWHDGSFWFETGPTTLKGRNVARDPRCALSLALHEYDLVIEGTAQRSTDPAEVATLSDVWNGEGWPCQVDDSGIALTADYSAPSAGAPPWFVYRITANAATALATVEPGGATRFTF